MDFFHDNIDLAFRLGPLDDSSLVARWLWSVPYSFCAGRDFAEAHDIGDPISLDRLRALPAIVSRQPWLLERGEQVRPGNIVHELDDLDLIAEAVRRNMGVAMLPRDMVDRGLQELAILDAAPLSRKMHAVYPGRRLLPARVRNLIDFMVVR